MALPPRTDNPEADIVGDKPQNQLHTVTSTKSPALTGKLEAELEIKASPEQFYNMVANKPHHMHHACYDKIQGCDLHEGEFGKVGTVVIWRYVHGMVQFFFILDISAILAGCLQRHGRSHLPTKLKPY
ncbi:hypothetical protein GQ457_04G009700 [Hibiscus cannabinus]